LKRESLLEQGLIVEGHGVPYDTKKKLITSVHHIYTI
jgi:hypothetical protein